MVGMSKAPQSDSFTVSRLFKETNPLMVPRWQRDYSWEPSDHVANLLQDLSSFFEDCKIDDSRYYLLGQIIVVQNGKKEFEIVDGQQRITTLFILCLALRNRLKSDLDNANLEHTVTFANVHSVVSDSTGKVRLKNPFQDGTAVLQYLLENDKPAIKTLGVLSKPQRNLIEVYEVIDEWISDNLKTFLDLQKYSEAVLSNIYLSRLQIDDIPLALDYFEKMNRRGLPLAAADLLKNYLFSQVPDSRFDDLTDKWKAMSAEVDKSQRVSLKSTEAFIKYWAISDSGSKLNGTDQLLAFWKKQLSTETQISKFADSLLEMSTIYQKSTNGISSKSGKSILEATRFFNGSQHLPVVFAGKDLNNFDYLCELVDRRFLIYNFAKERTATFESMIPNWCNAIRLLPKNASNEQILEASINSKFFVVEDAHELILNSVTSLDYSKSSHGRKLRMVLAVTNKYMDTLAKNGDFAEPLGTYLSTVSKSKPGIDMDHVFGQTYFNEENEETRIKFNSIGALTLVFSSDHREQTKLLPIEKESMYIKSRYMLTKSLANIDKHEPPRVRKELELIQDSIPVSLSNWTTDFVDLRSQFIAQKFIESIGLAEFSAK